MAYKARPCETQDQAFRRPDMQSEKTDFNNIKIGCILIKGLSKSFHLK